MPTRDWLKDRLTIKEQKYAQQGVCGKWTKDEFPTRAQSASTTME